VYFIENHSEKYSRAFISTKCTLTNGTNFVKLFKAGSYYKAHTGLELQILLLYSPVGQDYRHTPSCPR
jgi:hypothetical protein